MRASRPPIAPDAKLRCLSFKMPKGAGKKWIAEITFNSQECQHLMSLNRCMYVCLLKDHVDQTMGTHTPLGWLAFLATQGSFTAVSHQMNKEQEFKKPILQCLLTIGLTVFASVDLQCQQGKGDPSPEHLPSAGGRTVHPSQPSLMVRQRQHLHESGDPWLSYARWRVCMDKADTWIVPMNEWNTLRLIGRWLCELTSKYSEAYVWL